MDSNTTVKKANPLGYAPIGSLIAKFAIPSVISFLVTAAYNITDQIFIGHVIGMLGNAATNVAFPIVTLTTALAQLAGVGTAANFNLRMGAKEEDIPKLVDVLCNGDGRPGFIRGFVQLDEEDCANIYKLMV